MSNQNNLLENQTMRPSLHQIAVNALWFIALVGLLFAARAAFLGGTP